jgi:hypothetical protein
MSGETINREDALDALEALDRVDLADAEKSAVGGAVATYSTLRIDPAES